LAQQKNGKQFVGENKATVRLGRGITLRTQPNDKFDRTRATLHHKGPYMPVVYEACGEKEFSYEYEHGATSYGAFTYALAATLRRSREALTFSALLKETAKALTELSYEQHPEMAGPREVLRANVPWHRASDHPA